MKNSAKDIVQKLRESPNKENYFKYTYIWGIVLAIVFVSIGVANNFISDKPEKLISQALPILIFAWGIIHILLLSLFWWQLNIDAVNAGSRIQTGGYLYTLISFVLMFVLLGTEFSFEAILLPMGTALITSILGWFIGGEISNSDKFKDMLRSETMGLVQDIGSFHSSLKKVHDEYIESVLKSKNELIRLQNSQLASNKLVLELFKQSENSTTTLIKTLKELGSDLTKAKEEFEKLTDANASLVDSLNALNKYVQQSEILIKQFESIIDTISQR